MNKTEPLPQPTLNEAMNSYVPPGAYLCRFTNKAIITRSGAGNAQIAAQFEVLSPDIVPTPTEQDPNRRSKVGGRKGNVYLSLEPTLKNYSDSVAAYDKLGLRDEEDQLVPTTILEKLNTGRVCAYILLDSEEDLARMPAGPGQRVGEPIKHPVTGENISRGWRFKFVSPNDIVSLAETPEDLPPLGKF